MVDEDQLFLGLSIGMILIAGIADILFLWIMHYTSTRYPRPSDDGTWNERYTHQHHDCCQQFCNEDLSHCLCGLRCRKLTCPMQCNCCYPMELFIPRYPRSFFSLIQPEQDTDIDDDFDFEITSDLELKTLRNGDEIKQNEVEEEKEAGLTSLDDIPTMKRRQSSLASIEQNSNLQILHDRYGKCCCCSCFSIIFKIWFLICGILSFTVFIVFAFTIFFEFCIKCLTWKYGQFLGLIVAIFIVCKILIWFLYHSLQSIWLLTYNICDANNVLIVEWWRFWQIFWCVMFAVIYLLCIDPQALNNALIGQSIARFMVLEGIVWMVIYWISVIFGSVWLILSLFEGNKSEKWEKCGDCLNPYKWKCVAKNSLCMPYCDDYATEALRIFENQKWSQYKVTLLDWMTGLRPYGLGNNKYCNYIQYAFVCLLIVCGVLFVIIGYIMGNGYELMQFSGWSFLIYYVLIILIKRDDFDAICFKMWNGTSYKKIYYLLKEIGDKHCENYYYSYLSNDNKCIGGRHVVILRYVDIWSVYHHPDSPNFWTLCCSIQQCNKNNDKNKKENVYSMWQLKQFNVQLWITILVLIIPFSLIIWALTEVSNARNSIIEYDTSSVSNWNWSSDALGNHEYPFCDHDLNGLNAFDLMWLSQSGWYFEDVSILKHSFKAWFGSNDTESGWDYNSTLLNFMTFGYKPTVYYIENIKYAMDVIVIRGSYTIADWLQDANLWSEVLWIQIVSLIVPINNVFDDTFLRDLVYLSSRFQGLIFPEIRERYDEAIYQFVVQYVLERNTSNTILIAGHSLGAGLAEIVASRLHSDGYAFDNNVIGFGLSPPGTLWSSKKFGYDLNDLDVSAISVYPRRDPVPMVDAHGGAGQYIDCDAYNLWHCHSAIRAMCELYHSCGPNNVRNVQFVECLCVDAKDWNYCVMYINPN